MVKRCVAAGCSNTYSENVSLFKFPKDPVLRQKWVKNVQRTRAQWSGPSEHSVLCSQHFDSSCFERDSELASQMGMQKRRRLKDDAVPTLFERPEPQESLLSEAGPSGSSISRKRSSSSSVADAGSSKKKRSAYEKRERHRVVSQLLSDTTHMKEPDTEAHEEANEQSQSPDQCDAEIQVSPDKKNARVQTSTKMKSIGLLVKPSVRSIGVQCSETHPSVDMRDVGVQCSLSAPVRQSVVLRYASSPLISDASQSDSEMSQGDIETPDLDTSAYTIQEDSSSHDSSSPSVVLPDSHSCYIVFESALLLLFTICRFCASRSVNIKKVVTGSFLHVTQKCLRCHHIWIWESQPYIGNIPAGNICTSAAILYAGALPTQALRVFKILNCHTISANTFFRHQKVYLQPAISTIWKSQQLAVISGLKDAKKKLTLSGDGRADSPGHSAKYGSYTVIEMSCNKVLDYRLVQSNEVGGSYHMEKEGLQRLLQFLQEQGLTVDVLVTDRHRQINKWLRESYPTITHYYDIWHVAKGFRKKVEAAAKVKGCELIGNWQRSIVNHLYWCVSSTPDGDADTILAKWLSLENHVHNKHRHKDKKFPKCTHGTLRSQDRKKKWFKRHSKASEKLTDLLTNAYLCKDITRLSPVHQTSSLEAFHSVVIHFAPKYVPFSYHGMNCRLALAALHFNENASRKQAVTKKGQELPSQLPLKVTRADLACKYVCVCSCAINKTKSMIETV